MAIAVMSLRSCSPTITSPDRDETEAFDALANGVKTEGYDTNRDTKPLDGAILS